MRSECLWSSAVRNVRKLVYDVSVPSIIQGIKVARLCESQLMFADTSIASQVSRAKLG